VKENYKIIDRIRLLMEYSMSKTLSENILVLEQKPDEMMPGQIEKFGYKQNDPSTINNSLKKQEKYFQDVKEYFETWDVHDWLDLASIAVLLVPEAGFFLSMAIDSYNAALFVQEGRNFEAGLRIAFSLIPAGVIFTKIPMVKKYGIKPTIELLSKLSRVEKLELTQTEKTVIEQVKKAQLFLKSASQKIIFEETVKLSMENSTLWVLVRMLRILEAKMPLIYLGGYVILSYYGIKWTYPKLAALFGVKPSDLPNNKYGFKKYCEFMQIQYVSYNDNNHIGTAKTDAGNLNFNYNPKNKIFEISNSSNKLKNITTNEDISSFIIKKINEAYPDENQRDSAFNSVYDNWDSDSVVSGHIQSQFKNKKSPQTDIEVASDWHTPMTKDNNKNINPFQWGYNK